MYYLSLPHDLSGSRSKNRFKTEVLWGISKMLDLIENKEKFTAVFDYACDVEIHYDERFEFYQIKTHASKNSYTIDSLTKIEGKGSILGKLYVLNKDGKEQDVKLAIVSNIPLKGKMKKGEFEEFCWVNLSEDEKIAIASALEKELEVNEVAFDKLFYIQTPINLKNPENEVRGKLIVTFEKVLKSEPSHPNALYRLIFGTALERASYEFEVEGYEDLLIKKGISSTELMDMLKCHNESAKTGISEVKEYISGLSNVSKKRQYLKALTNINRNLQISTHLKQLEQKIAIFLIQEEQLGDFEEVIDMLHNVFDHYFKIEYSDAERKVFYMIIIKKFECGVYDDEDDI